MIYDTISGKGELALFYIGFNIGYYCTRTPVVKLRI